MLLSQPQSPFTHMSADVIDGHISVPQCPPVDAQGFPYRRVIVSVIDVVHVYYNQIVITYI
jgi:hypothetical protein